MGRMYSGVFEGVSIGTAAQDVFEITAPSDAIVIIHEVTITFDDDEVSQMVVFALTRYDTNGSVGSVVTPEPFEEGDAAFGGVIDRNNTTQGGTPLVMFRRGVNVLEGVHWLFTPETRPVISPDGIFAVEFLGSGAGINASGEIIFEEVGG